MAKTKKSAKKKRLDTLSVKTREQKDKLLVYLEKYPVIEVACERAGIGRATYYSWRNQDHVFAKLARETLAQGNDFVNDMAESGLIQLIKEKKLGAIAFWLKNHHSGYSDRMLHRHEIVESELTSEQSETIGNALAKIGLANIITRGKLDMKTVERLLPKAEKIIALRETERKKKNEDWEREKNKSLGTAQEKEVADDEETIEEEDEG